MTDLRNDTIYTTANNIDWSEARGEDCEGYRVCESIECSECGEDIILDGFGEVQHCEHDPDSECKGYLNSEGPMMNYWYPIALDDCEDAARKISHLPLCVIEFKDGRTGLALTGGGQDLSWEICEAFVCLGFCPPLHFCGDLPRMAGGYHGDKTAVLEGAKRTAEVAKLWAERALERIEGFIKESSKDAA